MEYGLLLTLPQSQTPSILVPRLQFLQLKTNSQSHFHFFTSHHNHHLSLSFTLTPKTKFSKWDSNANRNFNEDNEEEEEEEEEETFSGNVQKMKKKRKWWSNMNPPKRSKKRPAIVFDQALESIFIFKVFKSYGWFLPVIIISFLLSTGIKAFLTSLALYVALSVLFLAVQKLWGMTQWKPIRKAGMRKKASSMKASSIQMEDKEGEEIQDTRETKMDKPSWVGSDNGPVNKGTQNVAGFGGWDFLDEARPMRGTSQVPSEAQKTKEEKLSGNGRRVVASKSQRVKHEKLSGNGRSGNGRSSDIPLLVRLLIAVFPFIGFWAKLFW